MQGIKISNDDDIVMKYCAEDFFVQECCALKNVFPVSFSDTGKRVYELYLLAKRGMSTLDAVDFIAMKAKLNSRKIGYSGLKDEDGVTIQYITIPHRYQRCRYFDSVLFEQVDNDTYLQLYPTGFSDEPQRIGRIVGNAFSIVIRNIECSLGEKLSKYRNLDILFPNYYGLQRFGRPGLPKIAHVAGRAIVDGDYCAACEILGIKKAKESFRETLLSQSGLLQLICNAYSSDGFNKTLSSVLRNAESETVTERKEGHRYDFFYGAAASEGVIDMPDYLPYMAFYVKSGGEIGTTNTRRKSMRAVTFHFGDIKKDRYNMGRYAQELSFFLPSGSYATVAVNQLYWHILHDEPKEQR